MKILSVNYFFLLLFKVKMANEKISALSIKNILKYYRRTLRLRWRHFKITLLGFSIKLIPKEQQRVFILTLIIGLACGLAAVGFHLSILKGESLLINSVMQSKTATHWLLIILLPTLGGLLCGFLLSYVAPGARGSGIPQVKIAYTVKGGRLPMRDAVGKFFISALQISSGASFGREGPTVHICATLSSWLGRVFALSQANLQKLLPVGAAAGIAAAFNAPIAAVTFTIEEVVGDLDQTVLSGVIVAAALASVIERAILGEHPVLSVGQQFGLHNASSLIFYAALGCAAAVISLAFTESLLKLRVLFGKLTAIPVWMRPGIGGLVTGILILTALLWLNSGGINGSGYDVLSSALSGELALKTLLALCVIKLIATVFSYSSGGAGGIFAPSLFIGAMLGGAVGFLYIKIMNEPTAEIGAFALVGMGAVFAGIIRAPITSVLIIFEMTGSYGLILPLMLANMTAYGLARKYRPTPIYEALLEQDGIFLPHDSKQLQHSLDSLKVSEAMTTNVFTLNEELSVAEALEQVRNLDFTIYPVLNAAAQCVGMISEVRLRRNMAEKGGKEKIGKLADKNFNVTPNKRIRSAITRMNNAEVRQLAVISPENQKFLGIITMTDIVRAEAESIPADQGLSTTVTPGFNETKIGISRSGEI